MVNKIQTVEEMVNEIMSEYNKYRLSEVSVWNVV
jgi:hypothetical protein